LNCSTNKLKQWIVYDEKSEEFLEFTNEEFKNLLLDRPIQLIDKKLYDKKTGNMIYIDGILNR